MLNEICRRLNIDHELGASLAQGAKTGAKWGMIFGGSVSLVCLVASGFFVGHLGAALSGSEKDINPLTSTRVAIAGVWTVRNWYYIPLSMIGFGLKGAMCGMGINFARYLARPRM